MDRVVVFGYHYCHNVLELDTIVVHINGGSVKPLDMLCSIRQSYYCSSSFILARPAVQTRLSAVRKISVAVETRCTAHGGYDNWRKSDSGN